MGNSLMYDFYRKFMDEEGADTLSYATLYIIIWLGFFLGFMYLSDHSTLFKGRIYDFPIDPAREPLPREKEVVNE